MSQTVTDRTILYVGGAETPGADRLPSAERVLTATTARETLDAVADGAADCVVVGTRATDVARRVRERYPEVPMVVRTDAGPIRVATGAVPVVGSDGEGTTPREDALARSVESAVTASAGPAGLLDTLEVGVYALDADCRFVVVNEALAELTGYDRAELLGAHLSFVLDDANVEAASERLAHLQHGEAAAEDDRFEVDLVRADGEQVPVEVGVSPVEPDGLVAVTGAVRDVTDRCECRREWELWRAMVDTVTDGLYALDGDRNVVAASEGLARLAGRDIDSLLGEHISVWVDEETIEENVDERRAIMDGDQKYGEWEFDVVRPDGERVSVENRYTGLPSEEGLYGTAGVVRDVRGRRERERERELWRAMVESVTDGLYALDADRNVIAVNEAFAEMVGRTRESLIGEHISVCMDDSLLRETEAERRAILEGELPHGQNELDLIRADGERIPVEIRYAVLPWDEGEYGTTGVVRDVTERRRRERALAELHDWTRKMVRAEDGEEVVEAAAGAVGALFEEPNTGVYTLDSDRGQLTLVDCEGSGSLPPALTEGPVWEAFVSGTVRTVPGGVDSTEAGPNQLGAGLVHPLGTHGVVVVGWGREKPVPRDTSELAAVLAANVETALDRATVESTLRDRERRLTNRNEELARLDRTNAVIRGVHRALVSARNREAGRVAVTDWLTEADPYALAWFARVTGSGNDTAVEPAVGGGDVGRTYVDAARSWLPGSPLESLVTRAATTHEVQIQPGLLDAPDWLALRSDALKYGYRSVAAIPVTASGSLDGVLVVHGTDAGTFPPADAEVLSELGGLIGRTLRAVDRASLGSPDHSVTVDVEIPGRQLVFSRLSAEVDAPVTLEGAVALLDGNVMFYTSAPVDGETLHDAMCARDGMSDVGIITDDDSGTLVKFRKSRCQLTTIVHEAGGRLNSVCGTSDGSTVRLELPVDADVRAVVEAVDAIFPGTTLRARRESDSPDTPRTVRAALRERCTDRQYEALTGAYYSGYYEWPRLTTVGELAERAGVSSPTYQYHLRASERKLLDIVVD
jgi:PAS domain S-box-containing protein